MNILSAVSHFMVFVVLRRFTGVEPGPPGAATMSPLLVARDAVIRRKMPKPLERGTVLLFDALTLYEGMTGAVKFTGWYPDRKRAASLRPTIA